MAIGGLVGSCCALTADSVAATASSTTTLNLLVDSASSGHYIDNASMPGVFERFPDYRLLTIRTVSLPSRTACCGRGNSTWHDKGLLRTEATSFSVLILYRAWDVIFTL